MQCYVKGGLQPTRSFGDFRLKMREFNFHNYDEKHGYRLPIPVFSGPYIDATPDIQVHDLTEKDKWIVLATDGLWNNFPRKATATLVHDTVKEERQSKDNESGAHIGQKIVRK